MKTNTPEQKQAKRDAERAYKNRVRALAAAGDPEAQAKVEKWASYVQKAKAGYSLERLRAYQKSYTERKGKDKPYAKARREDTKLAAAGDPEAIKRVTERREKDRAKATRLARSKGVMPAAEYAAKRKAEKLPKSTIIERDRVRQKELYRKRREYFLAGLQAGDPVVAAEYEAYLVKNRASVAKWQAKKRAAAA